MRLVALSCRVGRDNECGCRTYTCSIPQGGRNQRGQVPNCCFAIDVTQDHFRRLKITGTSTERQKHSQTLAPVLVIISGNSRAFPRKIITSIGFYRCCALAASAPVVVKNRSPTFIHTHPRAFGRSFFTCG